MHHSATGGCAISSMIFAFRLPSPGPQLLLETRLLLEEIRYQQQFSEPVGVHVELQHLSRSWRPLAIDKVKVCGVDRYQRAVMWHSIYSSRPPPPLTVIILMSRLADQAYILDQFVCGRWFTHVRRQCLFQTISLIGSSIKITGWRYRDIANSHTPYTLVQRTLWTVAWPTFTDQPISNFQ